MYFNKRVLIIYRGQPTRGCVNTPGILDGTPYVLVNKTPPFSEFWRCFAFLYLTNVFFYVILSLIKDSQPRGWWNTPEICNGTPTNFGII